MGEMLSFEADRRNINITINALDTELTKDQRESLYCSFGTLYPEGCYKLRNAETIDQVRAAPRVTPSTSTYLALCFSACRRRAAPARAR
jgi:vacuolar-type H+-ATPase subunit C/Vma6